MFSRYLSKFKQLFKNTEKGYKFSERTYYMSEENLAMQQLLKLFPEGTLLPHTAWSLSPRQTLHICNEMLIDGKRHVIEFGMGFSTLCLAQLIKLKGWNAHIYTVDNSQEWVDKLMQTVRELGLVDYITPIVVPISPLNNDLAYKNQTLWYDTNQLALKLHNAPKMDIVIVDGPYGGTTPFARYSAFPFIKPYLSSDYVVFLDDTDRSQEKEIALAWKKQFEGKMFDYRFYTVFKSGVNAFDIAPYRVMIK